MNENELHQAMRRTVEALSAPMRCADTVRVFVEGQNTGRRPHPRAVLTEVDGVACWEMIGADLGTVALLVATSRMPGVTHVTHKSTGGVVTALHVVGVWT